MSPDEIYQPKNQGGNDRSKVVPRPIDRGRSIEIPKEKREGTSLKNYTSDFSPPI